MVLKKTLQKGYVRHGCIRSGVISFVPLRCCVQKWQNPCQRRSLFLVNVGEGNNGQYFGSLNFNPKTNSTQVIGISPLYITQIPSQFLTYPYYLDPLKPFSENEFVAPNFLTQVVSRGLSLGEPVPTKEYVTLAAKLDLANECLVALARIICNTAYQLRPRATYGPTPCWNSACTRVYDPTYGYAL